jgi:hypothetical protein
VLDSLVHRKDGDVAGTAKPTRVEQALETSEDLRASIAVRVDAFHGIRAWKCEGITTDPGHLVVQEVVCFVSEKCGDISHVGSLVVGDSMNTI